MSSMDRSFFTLITLVFSLGSVDVLAQDAGEINQIIRGLAPIAGQTIASHANNTLVAPTPGLEITNAPQSVLLQVVLPGQVIFVDTTYAIDYEVYFPFDSAELTPLAHKQLLALGQALASTELRPHRYLIAGHTDGMGQAAYNKSLSERRASAVTAFLTESFPISPDRLISIGFGQERLKLPADPRAAINRRVEVMLIARP